jgi:hypothetical protein
MGVGRRLVKGKGLSGFHGRSHKAFTQLHPDFADCILIQAHSGCKNQLPGFAFIQIDGTYIRIKMPRHHFNGALQECENIIGSGVKVRKLPDIAKKTQMVSVLAFHSILSVRFVRITIVH